MEQRNMETQMKYQVAEIIIVLIFLWGVLRVIKKR